MIRQHRRANSKGMASALRRRGAVLVECAICVPIILMFALGTLEICSAIFLQETVKVAAFESARVAIQRQSTAAKAKEHAEALLLQRGVTNPTVTITPSDLNNTPILEPITVDVSVPYAGNTFFLGGLFSNGQVSTRVVMLKEYAPE